MKYSLWYRKPAEKWTEALPSGNGKIGVMAFGGVSEERLALNEDTLWSGFPKDKNCQGSAAHLEQVRSMIKAGQIKEAEKEANTYMLGEWTEAYLPLGNLRLFMPEIREYSDYRRSLDIRTGIQTTEFTANQVKYIRQVFVSYPAQAMFVRLESSVSGKITVSAEMDSQLHSHVYEKGKTLRFDGRCPVEAMPVYYECANPVVWDDKDSVHTVRFASALTAENEGGTVSAEKGRLLVQNADAVTFRFQIGTSFQGFGKIPDGDEQARLAALRAIPPKNWQEELDIHCTDFTALFDRVDVDFGHGENLEKLSTLERLEAVHEGSDDPDLCALLFQYGRYLLISSSRPGSTPANLQGIWNEEMRAPWSSNYTININTEMNYWLAETCNLSECVEPFIEWMQELSVKGQETARIHYGKKGWVAHHNSDIWGHTAPVGDPLKSYEKWDSVGFSAWPLGSGWLCETLWEHYNFGRDREYLRKKAYPVMREAARFYLDFLTQDERGQLVTYYSISPENNFWFNGKRVSFDKSPTMDTAIIRELFLNCLDAQKALDITDELTEPLENAIGRLPPFTIGEDGRLLEWSEERKECQPKHRHLSHLYGLYPSFQITPEDTPELADACAKSLLGRGFGGTGWSLAWKICLWARLANGENCYRLVRQQLTPIESTEASVSHGGGSYPNLMCAHPPFQIDGNFGYSAGVAEMLLQSHRPELKILPALPKEWHTGYAKGLKIRGGRTISVSWKEGRLVNLEYLSDCRR